MVCGRGEISRGPPHKAHNARAHAKRVCVVQNSVLQAARAVEMLLPKDAMQTGRQLGVPARRARRSGRARRARSTDAGARPEERDQGDDGDGPQGAGAGWGKRPHPPIIAA